METINLELIFSDLDILERRIDRLKKALKGDKKYQGELALCEKIKENLESGRMASRVSYAPEEEELLKNIDLLTLKPILFIANLSEEDFKRDLEANENYLALKEIAKAQNAGIVPICAKIEEEISELSPRTRSFFCPRWGFRVGPRPDRQGKLRAARAHQLPDRRGTGGSGLDHQKGHQSPRRRRKNPQRF